MTNPASVRVRSWLFTPATRPDRFAKASEAGADVAILDLEDAVAPKDKAQARITALDNLAGSPADGVLHALRVNGLDTRAGISDLDALLGSRAAPDFLVLPKTETAGHLQILDRLLTAAGKATAARGKISRIVPRLEGPVTTPRIDTHYIVTEFGAVNLKGLSSTERALRLIELAHSEFRDGLRDAAKELHLV